MDYPWGNKRSVLYPCVNGRVEMGRDKELEVTRQTFGPRTDHSYPVGRTRVLGDPSNHPPSRMWSPVTSEDR